MPPGPKDMEKALAFNCENSKAWRWVVLLILIDIACHVLKDDRWMKGQYESLRGQAYGE